MPATHAAVKWRTVSVSQGWLSRTNRLIRPAYFPGPGASSATLRPCPPLYVTDGLHRAPCRSRSATTACAVCAARRTVYFVGLRCQPTRPAQEIVVGRILGGAGREHFAQRGSRGGSRHGADETVDKCSMM